MVVYEEAPKRRLAQLAKVMGGICGGDGLNNRVTGTGTSLDFSNGAYPASCPSHPETLTQHEAEMVLVCGNTWKWVPKGW